jgi:hypothetical protein
MSDPALHARHPWTTGNLSVPRAVLDQVDQEARRAYAADEESCGFLVGPAGARTSTSTR